ncbi:hypothetical protein K523DRAFT_373222 [Schizophyllum commune Tattone D]|nr:hypothetical protein K523DRAFT_373222 [Schizophyllum commune Tattone D]
MTATRFIQRVLTRRWAKLQQWRARKRAARRKAVDDAATLELSVCAVLVAITINMHVLCAWQPLQHYLCRILAVIMTPVVFFPSIVMLAAILVLHVVESCMGEDKCDLAPIPPPPSRYPNGPFITVKGAGIDCCHSVGDLLCALRKQHRIADLRKIQQCVIFPPFARVPMDPNQNLVQAGVRNLSVVYVQHSVLGGSGHLKDQVPLDEPFQRPSKRRRHREATRDEEVTVDEGGQRVRSRNKASHESSAAHRAATRKHASGRLGQHTESVAGPSSAIEEEPGSVLGGILDAMALDPHPSLPVTEETDVEYAERDGLDWNAPELRDADLGFQPPIDHDTALPDEVYEGLLRSFGEESSDSEAELDAPPDERDQLEGGGEGEGEAGYETYEEVGDDNPWFPWPSRLTYIFDVLRNIPRCAFSRQQIGAIRWGMAAAGVESPPSDRTMDNVNNDLQQKCGIRSIRYKGKLGHIYYVNDLAGIVAQEMANPHVRRHLRFLPEDSGTKISEAWQADRWLHELDPKLATPMIRIGRQDYYTFEPLLLASDYQRASPSERAYMPVRWFTRGQKTLAQAWRLLPSTSESGERGWVVDELVQGHTSHAMPDPRNIFGICRDGTSISPWDTSLSVPKHGNPWRVKSRGHRTVGMPLWLYCDDTSGNVSKRWNKHNSFLFTAAGLPRREVHKESSIHFLSTSNIAPPLEMLDGIVDQLEDIQENGIWAWDCVRKELVLVIVSILAMLGDNPMQSEFACHVGFMGRLFCRVCWATRGSAVDDDDDDDEDDELVRGYSSDDSEVSSRKGRRTFKNESFHEMVQRLHSFVKRARPRARDETLEALRSQFDTALRVGGKTEFKRKRTATGVKDTFMEYLLGPVFAASTRRGGTKASKQRQVDAIKATLPSPAYSPIWRIRDFNPHSDTPVEILHVILLGFVKYFWRDTLSRLKKDKLEILRTRLSSFDVSGLGVDPLSGERLVTYGRSLTGADFRIIAQVFAASVDPQSYGHVRV